MTANFSMRRFVYQRHDSDSHVDPHSMYHKHPQKTQNHHDNAFWDIARAAVKIAPFLQCVRLYNGFSSIYGHTPDHVGFYGFGFGVRGHIGIFCGCHDFVFDLLQIRIFSEFAETVFFVGAI